MCIILFPYYKDDPNPEYDPWKKIPTKPITMIPAAVPISHKGILPVVLAIEFNPLVFKILLNSHI